MNILLDTHIYLWWLCDDKSLSKQARALIKRADDVYISSASIWEAAIKIQLGKLTADINSLADAIVEEGFSELSIRASHAALTLTLPLHHRDPFDRILIAQAMSEPLRLITADRTLAIYSELVQVV